MNQQNTRPSVETLFLDALDVPTSNRAEFLSRACDGDDALRRQIEELLRADNSTSGEESAGVRTTMLRRAAGLTLLATSVEVLPIRLERYDLIRRIGEGSFGVVYRASQRSPVRRDVAIKVLRPGLDSPDIARRFDFEKQALAGLEHPNIARIFDAGDMPDGRPYFVMELLDGLPMTTFCDDHRLSLRSRLELYLDVCAAVEYAHRRAILHRDLKPSNVLVHGGRVGTIKVIDFGIAKAVGGGSAAGTLLTDAGRPLGTPEYMSPEQVAGETDRIDTRSDVYALGAMLYELLCGRLPFGSEQLRSSAAQMQRLICQVEPPRPSAAWAAGADGLNAAALARSISSEGLQTSLRRELEWIPLKALRKDPVERYGSVADLARDVSNYLAGLPLSAGPRTVRYRCRKFVVRNRVTVTLAALLFASILTGLIVGGVVLHRARIAEAHAQAEQINAQNVAAMLRVQKANAFIAVGRFGQAGAELDMARDQLAQLGGGPRGLQTLASGTLRDRPALRRFS